MLLIDAPAEFGEESHQELISKGFTQTKFDPKWYILWDDKGELRGMVNVYVDDLAAADYKFPDNSVVLIDEAHVFFSSLKLKKRG